jgi:putative oxidoreductase
MSRGRDLALLTGRTILGSYLAAHGAQKLFSAFGGFGLDVTGDFFEKIGLRPGRLMATTAGMSELGGGLLTLAGLAHPLGPVSLAGTMAVASSTHRANGPFTANRGFELPLTNMAAALLLAAFGPGRYSLDGVAGTALPRPAARAVVLGTAVASAAALSMVLRYKPPAAEPTASSHDEPEPAAESTAEPEGGAPAASDDKGTGAQ